jgi:cytochrome c
MQPISLTAMTLVVAGLVACGGGAAAPHAEDAVTHGATLYGDKCARCHGDKGQGDRGPAVVGQNALPLDPPSGAKVRHSQFHNAKDVFDFVKASMPPDHGGSLSDDEYWAILAFDLKANGVQPPPKLDAESASAIVLH